MKYTNKIFVPFDERPRCQHRGCNEPAQNTGNYRKDGTPCFRKLCAKHHIKKTAARHGMKTLAEVVAAKRGITVSEYSLEVRKRTAEKAGMTVAEYTRAKIKERARKAGMTVSEYMNRSHPYRKHRKEFCENRDGRLGFRCRYKIRHSAQLQVDHINGNPNDNRPKNLQTLCANCHCYKTHMNEDYASPGRKTLKKAGFLTGLVG